MPTFIAIHECIQRPALLPVGEGSFIVTAVTADGETPFCAPITVGVPPIPIPPIPPIVKIPLTVTADATIKHVGTSDPAFTVAYSGFTGGDTLASLGGILTFTRTPAGETVGFYTVTPSGLTSDKYFFIYVSAVFTITFTEVFEAGRSNVALTNLISVAPLLRSVSESVIAQSTVALTTLIEVLPLLRTVGPDTGNSSVALTNLVQLVPLLRTVGPDAGNSSVALTNLFEALPVFATLIIESANSSVALTSLVKV